MTQTCRNQLYFSLFFVLLFTKNSSSAFDVLNNHLHLEGQCLMCMLLVVFSNNPALVAQYVVHFDELYL